MDRGEGKDVAMACVCVRVCEREGAIERDRERVRNTVMALTQSHPHHPTLTHLVRDWTEKGSRHALFIFWSRLFEETFLQSNISGGETLFFESGVTVAWGVTLTATNTLPLPFAHTFAAALTCTCAAGITVTLGPACLHVNER